MSDEYIQVAELGQLVNGAGRVFRVRGRTVALFLLDGAVHALDNACPHRDGPLGEGTLAGPIVTCPHHSWQFDVTTGSCVGRPGRSVTRYPVRVQGNSVSVQVPAAAPSESGEVNQALVRFGAMGHVGRFHAAPELTLDRGAPVVVESSRGMELGEVLWTGSDGAELVENQPDSGRVLRRATEADLVTDRLLREGLQGAFDVCRAMLAERRVVVDLVDAERLLDGRTIIFYFLGDPPPVLADITADLTDQIAAQVQFRPFGEAALADCGSCGEGEHGCGQCGSNGACTNEQCGDGPHKASIEST